MRSTADLRVLEKQLTEQLLGYSPQRWITGIAPPTERSKPLGLTKEHTYTDNDGDYIEIDATTSTPESVAMLTVTNNDSGRLASAYIGKSDSIPLALNALGWDRPDVTARSWPKTVVGNETSDMPIPRKIDERDRLHALAIECLRAVDIYDQRVAQRKQHEEEAEAKRKAEYEASKKESFERAKEAYADAIRDQIAAGIDADSTAKVQVALSAYETARRKFEGLPH